MNKMNKKLILLCLIAVCVCGIAPESKAAPRRQPKMAVPKEQPKMGGTLVVGLGLEFSNPHPFIKTTSIGQFVKESSYEPLLASDENNRVVPNLAEAYEISAGGTAYTLRLRKGVRFHNGKEMKADDVVWSANYVKEPKNGATGQNLMNDVKSIEKLDDYTVKFTLPRPSITFRTYLTSIRMLPIVPANSLQPGQIKLEANTFVPGTGPFIFDQYQPGFDTVLKKFPDYWGGPAYLDKLIFRPIADDPNRFNALRSGDVHMAERLAPLDAARIKKGQIKGLTILEEPDGFRALGCRRKFITTALRWAIVMQKAEPTSNRFG